MYEPGIKNTRPPISFKIGKFYYLLFLLKGYIILSTHYGSYLYIFIELIIWKIVIANPNVNRHIPF